MYVRASTKINERQELFATYTHSLLPTMLRRDNLREGKFFDCECARCADPTELGTHMSSLKCTKCNNGVVTSSNSLGEFDYNTSNNYCVPNKTHLRVVGI